MAKNQKENAKSENIKNKTNVTQTKESSSFDEKEIFAEIQQVMKEGSYRKAKKKEDAEIISPISKENTKAESQVLPDKQKAQKETKKDSTNKEASLKSKKKKEKKVYEHTTFKHKMKVLGILMVMGVFTGSGLGVWYFNYALKSNVDYTLYNRLDYIADTSAVFTKNGLTEGSSWVEQAKAQSMTPLSMSTVDNILLCSYNASNSSSFTAMGTGAVYTMGTEQSVWSAKYYDGTSYAFESISKGILTVATCDVLIPAENKVVTYNGKNVTATGAEWNYGNEKSRKAFEDEVGVMPSDILPYIISDKTVEAGAEIVKEEDGNYSFTIKMAKEGNFVIYSVLDYHKQVRRSGGLEAPPEFSEVTIKFTINGDWQFVKTEIEEVYKAVKFGVPTSCKGTLTTEYQFNHDVTMPSLKG